MPTASAPPSAYLDLAQRYPDTTAGEYAALLGAESLFVNGDYAQAQQQFSKYIEDHPESALVAEAKVGVAACQEAQGKSADAIQSYSSIISTYPSDINISEPARLTLARLEEQANRPDQALTLYSNWPAPRIPTIPGLPRPATAVSFYWPNTRSCAAPDKRLRPPPPRPRRFQSASQSRRPIPLPPPPRRRPRHPRRSRNPPARA